MPNYRVQKYYMGTSSYSRSKKIRENSTYVEPLALLKISMQDKSYAERLQIMNLPLLKDAWG